jgi:transposase-like protein
LVQSSKLISFWESEMSDRKHRSEAEWQALVAEQLQSGQSGLDFCREHGLYAKTFYRQRKVLRKKGLLPTGSSFVQLKPESVQRILPQPGSVLQYQGSHLHLPPGTNPAWLAELMKALP